MKALKIVGVIVIALAALIALVVILALTPAIQTWAVRKATANVPGLQLNVARVSAGLSAADLNDIRVVKDGMTITAKHVMAKYSAWDFFSHRRISVDDLAVEDLIVDLRAGTKANTAEPPATGPAVAPAGQSAPATTANAKPAQPFAGILNQAKLPYDVRVTRFSVPGRVLLSANQAAVFEIHGSDITTGQRGTVDWKVDFTDGRPETKVRAVHSTGTAAVHITTERRIDVAELNTIASTEGSGLPADQLKLQVKAEQPAAGGNEGYAADVSLVRGAATEKLVNLTAQYDASARQVSGAWSITVRSEQLAAMLSGLGLPDTAINGAGKFSFKPDANVAATNGEIQSTLSHLEKISPELTSIGSLTVLVRFDAGLADNVAHLDQLILNVTGSDGRQYAKINTLQKVSFSLADKRVALADTKAELARISVQALPLSWAQPFAKALTIDSGDLSLVLAVAAEADGSRVRITTIEPVAIRDLTVRNGAQKLADRLTLTVKPLAEYSADILHAELNDLSVSQPTGDTVTGRYTADVTHLAKEPQITFTADTQARFVAALKPYLNVETGPIVISTQSEGSKIGQTLQFTRSSTRITRGSGALITAIDLQQPLSLNLQTNAASTPKPDAEALRIKIGQIPLSWAEGVVPNSRFAGQISGGTMAIMLRSVDDVAANVTEPIRVQGIGVTMNNQAMLQGVDVTVDFAAGKKDNVAQYDVRRIEAKQGPTTLLVLAVAGQAKLPTQPGAKIEVTAKGTLEGDIAALTQQPVAAAGATLSHGELNATFDTALTKTIQATAKVTIKNLIAKQNNQKLGDAELDLSATVQPDGSSLLKVPFTFTTATRKSDVLIDGRLATSGKAVTFDGRITSNQIFVDDLQALSVLSPSTPSSTTTPTVATTPSQGRVATAPRGTARTTTTPAAPATSTTPSVVTTGAARDSQAFWAAAGGKIEIDLKQISYGRDYVISQVRGAADITPTKLSLSSLEGRFKENPFKLSATINFDANAAQPYTLVATADVDSFDVGAFLKAANSNEPPQLETKVTVNAKINGQGGTVNSLAQNAYGTFDVNGSKGILRALGKKGGSVATGASGLLGLAGAASGSQGTSAVGDLIKKFNELPFDRFMMHVERGADLNLKVGSIEFISPDTRITGSGGIQNQPGVPIQNQPMQFTMQLAGKDHMAVLLDRVKMLNGRQDEQGYYLMSRTFTLKGTPSNADANDLWAILLQVGVNNLLPGLLNLLGK